MRGVEVRLVVRATNTWAADRPDTFVQHEITIEETS